MTDYNTPDNNNESFVRWQQLTLAERSKAINLFLGALFATLGFVITRLVDKDFVFYSPYSKAAILLGSAVGLISICCFIIMILNRLKDFRISTELARLGYIKDNGNISTLKKQAEKTGKITHCLHKISLCCFAVCEVLVVIGFIIQVSNKF